MAKNKTTEENVNVGDFLNLIADKNKRDDGFALLQIMQEQTGLEARMWGPSIVGFGSYHYKYESGHEGDAPLVGFSPRKDAISLYTMLDPAHREAILARLGKHKAAKSCIYIKKLKDVNLDVLKELIDESVKISGSKNVSSN